MKGEVLRLSPIPEHPARGRLLVAQDVLDRTSHALRGFGGDDGRHEGLVLWLGVRTQEGETHIFDLEVPEVDHSWGRVELGRTEVGKASKLARKKGLSLLMQVHSHPTWDARHSSGDDHMTLMPFEGGFSLVVGHYGDDEILPSSDLGLHQFQDGRWILVRPVEGAFIVAD